MAAGAAVLVAAIVFVQRLLRGDPAYDFSYIWLAGRMWRAGIDPYSDALGRLGGRFMPAGIHVPELWVYPPQWAPIAGALSLLPYDDAARLWALLNALALTAAVALFWRAAQRCAVRPPVWLGLLTLAIVLSSGATELLMSLGQTAAIALLGFALLIDGYAHGRRWMATAGLVLLLLKPQLGLFILPVALALPPLRRSVLAAGLVSAALCAPLLLAFGPDQLIGSARNLLDNLDTYSADYWNQPFFTTGFAYLAWLIGMPQPHRLLLLLLAVALALALLGRRRHAGPPVERVWLAMLAPVVALVPLHLYDLVLLPIMLLIAPGLARRGAAWTAAAVALAWRPYELCTALAIALSAWPGGRGDAPPLWQWPTGLLTLSGAIILAAGLFGMGRRSGSHAVIR